MNNRKLMKGLAVLGAGLLASIVSSFLEVFGIFVPASVFSGGFFNWLSGVAFCVAIFVLVRSRSTT